MLTRIRVASLSNGEKLFVPQMNEEELKDLCNAYTRTKDVIISLWGDIVPSKVRMWVGRNWRYGLLRMLPWSHVVPTFRSLYLGPNRSVRAHLKRHGYGVLVVGGVALLFMESRSDVGRFPMAITSPLFSVAEVGKSMAARSKAASPECMMNALLMYASLDHTRWPAWFSRGVLAFTNAALLRGGAVDPRTLRYLSLDNLDALPGSPLPGDISEVRAYWAIRYLWDTNRDIVRSILAGATSSGFERTVQMAAGVSDGDLLDGLCMLAERYYTARLRPRCEPKE